MERDSGDGGRTERENKERYILIEGAKVQLKSGRSENMSKEVKTMKQST